MWIPLTKWSINNFMLKPGGIDFNPNLPRTLRQEDPKAKVSLGKSVSKEMVFVLLVSWLFVYNSTLLPSITEEIGSVTILQ